MNIVNIHWNLFAVPVRQILWHLWWVRRRLFAVGNQESYFNTNAIDAFRSSPDFFMRFTVCLRSISIDAGLMSSWTSWLTLHRLSWRPLRILSSNCLWTSLNLLRFHGSFDRQIAHRFSWLWRMIPRQIWRRRLEEHQTKLNLKNDRYQTSVRIA